MKLRLLLAEPIHAALAEAAKKEMAQSDGTARTVWSEARALFADAVNKAEHPEFGEGMDIDTYAQLENITPDGARKRMKHLIAAGRAMKRNGRWVIFVDRQSA